MDEPLIAARPAVEAELPHPQVDRALIDRVVRGFYGRVARDERLGPIFARRIKGDWEPHLEKMTEFWSSVMLKTGNYNGRPVPAHLRLKEVVPEDFEIWLRLFGETVGEMCSPEVGDVFIDRARRIARSLQFAMFFKLPANDDAAGK